MPNIKPVSDLRNYYDVLSEVHENAPVFLTKNGRGAYAVITMDDYEAFERFKAIVELRTELERTLERDRVEGLLTEEQVKAKLGSK